MKLKTPSLSTILFLMLLALLIIPQTRTPIQVVVNSVKILFWSPSELDAEDQTQLAPFVYQLSTINGTNKVVEVGQGKPVFISYWATWCPPCLAELPSIQKLYTDYHEEVDFILITNEEQQKVRRFIDKNPYDLPLYTPRMSPPEKLQGQRIPTNYLIDAKGKIIIKETGAADWNSERLRGVLEKMINRQ